MARLVLLVRHLLQLAARLLETYVVSAELFGVGGWRGLDVVRRFALLGGSQFRLFLFRRWSLRLLTRGLAVLRASGAGPPGHVARAGGGLLQRDFA